MVDDPGCKQGPDSDRSDITCPLDSGSQGLPAEQRSEAHQVVLMPTFDAAQIADTDWIDQLGWGRLQFVTFGLTPK